MTVPGAGRTVVIATRASKLALAQTAIIEQALLARHPGLRVEVVRITTKGDTMLDRPLADLGDKGLFVSELEQALRERRVHLAVHSAKDLPSTQPPDMRIAAFTKREDARDVIVSNSGGLHDLPVGGRVGTSSPRRAAQLRALRPDLNPVDVRGNVDTRLRKLRDGEYDALLLAAAGLIRLGLKSEITEWLDPSMMLPAPGQGALGIEVTAGDDVTAAIVEVLNDAATATAVNAERAFLRASGGGCLTATAAYGTVSGSTLHLSGMIASPTGEVVRDTVSGPVADAESLGTHLARGLLERGGAVLLASGSRARVG